MPDFEAFFRTATGHEPYAYQARIAREGLHSRFRGIDRARVMADVIGRRDNRIVVATRVVEAGLDLDAAVSLPAAGHRRDRRPA